MPCLCSKWCSRGGDALHEIQKLGAEIAREDAALKELQGILRIRREQFEKFLGDFELVRRKK